MKIKQLKFMVLGLCLFYGQIGQAHVITPYLEMLKISNVGSAWVNVALDNVYTNPVIVCTYNLPSSVDVPATPRLTNVMGTSFDVRMQSPINANTATASDVYCTVSETGTFTVPFKYKAGTIDTSVISKSIADMADVTPTDITFTTPVMMGQVMSFNNTHFATFWSSRCTSRTSIPSPTSMCIAKHAGQLPTAGYPVPFTETLGYIVAEEGEYHLSTANLSIVDGADTIRGVGDAPPYNYTMSSSAYSYFTASVAAMDGGDGGWAVLYGAQTGSTLSLAVDEENISDGERNHTTEEIHYWAMEPITSIPTEMVINEILYKAEEFVELYVTASGNIHNYVLSSQDGVSQNYRFPDLEVNAGDYVIWRNGNGTNTSVGNVHTFYQQSTASKLTDTGDDVVLLKPVNDDATLLNGSGLHTAIPVDYVAYSTGSAIDTVPVSNNGVTVAWDATNAVALGGVADGVSISLTPNAVDGNTSACWEITASGNASGTCVGYKPTRSTNAGAGTDSEGENNNVELPVISVQKTVSTLSDGINGTVAGAKSIPGSVSEYVITVNNTGLGVADTGTVSVKDIIPINAKLCVATVANCLAPIFLDGVPSSGLSLNQFEYSQNNEADAYGYVPTADAEGADALVTHIKMRTSGTLLAQTGALPPSFQMKIYIILK